MRAGTTVQITHPAVVEEADTLHLVDAASLAAAQASTVPEDVVVAVAASIAPQGEVKPETTLLEGHSPLVDAEAITRSGQSINLWML